MSFWDNLPGFDWIAWSFDRLQLPPDASRLQAPSASTNKEGPRWHHQRAIATSCCWRSCCQAELLCSSLRFFAVDTCAIVLRFFPCSHVLILHGQRGPSWCVWVAFKFEAWNSCIYECKVLVWFISDVRYPMLHIWEKTHLAPEKGDGRVFIQSFSTEDRPADEYLGACGFGRPFEESGNGTFGHLEGFEQCRCIIGNEEGVASPACAAFYNPLQKADVYMKFFFPESTDSLPVGNWLTTESGISFAVAKCRRSSSMVRSGTVPWSKAPWKSCKRPGICKRCQLRGRQAIYMHCSWTMVLVLVSSTFLLFFNGAVAPALCVS